MSYSGMATPVKQFYTEASSTLRTATGGSTVVGAICMLKGVTINPGAANCQVKIYDGSTTGGTLVYQFTGGSAAGEGLNSKNKLIMDIVQQYGLERKYGILPLISRMPQN